MGVPAASSDADPIAAVFPLPRPSAPVLAVGAFLKTTLTAIDGAEARLTTDVGNLDTVEAIRDFEALAERLLATPGFAPVAVAHDLHPNFHSTRFAERIAAEAGIEAVPVQHHHAHIASVMAEHATEEPVIGLALDGFGLGTDGGSWGGELLYVDDAGFSRLGHLAHLAQPGGDKAAREPWRMGAAALHALGRAGEIAGRYEAIGGAGTIAQMLARGANCPPTSSCGRLFDAACGLLDVKLVAAFEGEAPMALEAMATAPEVDPVGWTLADGVLDFRPLLDRIADLDAEAGANLFHGTLAEGFADWAEWAAERTGVRRVALSGGCFLNGVMTARLRAALDGRGLDALEHRRTGPGDPAISLGQAWAVAMARG